MKQLLDSKPPSPNQTTSLPNHLPIPPTSLPPSLDNLPNQWTSLSRSLLPLPISNIPYSSIALLHQPHSPTYLCPVPTSIPCQPTSSINFLNPPTSIQTLERVERKPVVQNPQNWQLRNAHVLYWIEWCCVVCDTMCCIMLCCHALCCVCITSSLS